MKTMQNSITNSSSEWMTMDEAVVYLKISIRTLKGFIADRRITSYKPDGTYMRRFKKSDLDAFINSGINLSESDAVQQVKAKR